MDVGTQDALIHPLLYLQFFFGRNSISVRNKSVIFLNYVISPHHTPSAVATSKSLEVGGFDLLKPFSMEEFDAVARVLFFRLKYCSISLLPAWATLNSVRYF